MGTVRKRVQGGKETFVARWRDPSGKQHKKSFEKQRQAQSFLVNMQAEQMRGMYIDPRAGRMTLQDYVDTRYWPTHRRLRPTTRAMYDQHLRNHLLPALGDRSLASIRRTDAKAVVAALEEVLAPATVHIAFAVLRIVMQAAVEDELIAGNPCSRVKLPDVDPRVIEPLAPGKVLDLIDAMTPRYRITIWLAAGAGLREGEALGLLTRRIDFLRRRLHIEQQMQSGKLVPLKTKASRRLVPVDDSVLTALTEHLRRWPAETDAVIVTNRCNRPVQRSSFGYCWRQAVAGAGLPEGTRFHDLRHFYASTLIAAGLHPKTIQGRLGHATITETMDTYGHLFPEAEHEGRGAVDAIMTRQPRPSTQDGLGRV